MQKGSPTSALSGALRFRVKQNDIVASHSASYATPTSVTGATMTDGTGRCEANDSREPKPEAAQGAAADIPLAEVTL